MKNRVLKKAMAVLICASMVLSSMAPAFGAEESTAAEEFAPVEEAVSAEDEAVVEEENAAGALDTPVDEPQESVEISGDDSVDEPQEAVEISGDEEDAFASDLSQEKDSQEDEKEEINGAVEIENSVPEYVTLYSTVSENSGTYVFLDKDIIKNGDELTNLGSIWIKFSEDAPAGIYTINQHKIWYSKGIDTYRNGYCEYYLSDSDKEKMVISVEPYDIVTIDNEASEYLTLYEGIEWDSDTGTYYFLEADRLGESEGLSEKISIYAKATDNKVDSGVFVFESGDNRFEVYPGSNESYQDNGYFNTGISSQWIENGELNIYYIPGTPIKIDNQVSEYTTLYRIMKETYNAEKEEYEYSFSEEIPATATLVQGESIYVKLSDNAPLGMYCVTSESEEYDYSSITIDRNSMEYGGGYFGITVSGTFVNDGEIRIYRRDAPWMQYNISVVNDYPEAVGFYRDWKNELPFTGTFEASDIRVYLKNSLQDNDLYLIRNSDNKIVCAVSKDNAKASVYYYDLDDDDVLTVEKTSKKKITINNTIPEYVTLYGNVQWKEDDEQGKSVYEYSDPIPSSAFLLPGSQIFAKFSDTAPEGLYFHGESYSEYSKNDEFMGFELDGTSYDEGVLTVRYEPYPWTKLEFEVEDQTDGKVKIYNSDKFNKDNVFTGQMKTDSLWFRYKDEPEDETYYVQIVNDEGTSNYTFDDDQRFSLYYAQFSKAGVNKIILGKRSRKKLHINVSDNIAPYITVYNKMSSTWNGHEWEDSYLEPYENGEGNYYGNILYVKLADGAPEGQYNVSINNYMTNNWIYKDSNRYFTIWDHLDELYECCELSIAYEPFPWSIKQITVDNPYSDKLGLYCDSECTEPFTGTFSGDYLYAKAKSALVESESYELSTQNYRLCTITDADTEAKLIHYGSFSDVDKLNVKKVTKPAIKISNPYSKYVRLYRKCDEIYDDETGTYRYEYSLLIGDVCYITQGSRIYLVISDEAPDGYYCIGDGRGTLYRDKIGKLDKDRTALSVYLYNLQSEMTVEYEPFPWSNYKISVNNKSGGKLQVYNMKGVGYTNAADYESIFDGTIRNSAIVISPVYDKTEGKVKPLPDGEIYAVRTNEDTVGYVMGSESFSVSYESFEYTDTLTIEPVTSGAVYKVVEDGGLTDVFALYSDEECTKVVAPGSSVSIRNKYYLKCNGQEGTRYKFYVYDGKNLINESYHEENDVITITPQMEGDLSVFVPKSKVENSVKLTMELGEYADDVAVINGDTALTSAGMYCVKLSDLNMAKTGDLLYSDTMLKGVRTNKDSEKNIGLRTVYRYKDGRSESVDHVLPFHSPDSDVYINWIKFIAGKTVVRNISIGEMLIDKAYFNSSLESISLRAIEVPDSIIHLSEDMEAQGLKVYDLPQNTDISDNMDIPDSWVRLKDGDPIRFGRLVICNDAEVRRYYTYKDENKEYKYSVRAGEIRRINEYTGNSDVNITAEKGFKANISTADDLTSNDYAITYTTDGEAYQNLPEDGIIPYDAEVKVKSKGLNNTGKAYVITWTDEYDWLSRKYNYSDWWNTEHYPHDGVVSRSRLFSDDESVTLEMHADEWIHIEKADTCSFTVDNKVNGKNPEIEFYMGDDYFETPKKIESGDKIIKGDTISYRYSYNEDMKDAYSLTVSTFDQQGNKKEKTWIIGEGLCWGDITTYGDVKATVADVTDRKLVISGIPSDFRVEAYVKGSGKIMDCADGIISIPVGEKVKLNAYRKGDYKDKKALKLINTADDSIMGYVAPKYGYYTSSSVTFDMPDSDVNLKALAVDTAELIIDSLIIKNVKTINPFTCKKYDLQRYSDFDEVFYPDLVTVGKRSISYRIPVGEKVYFNVDLEKIEQNSKVTIKTAGKVLEEKTVYTHDKAMSFVMPGEKVTITTWRKTMDPNKLTITRKDFSDNTKVQTYVDDYDLGYTSAGTTFYENQKLEPKVAQISDNSKLLVKVKQTGTNEIITGSSQGIVVDNVKDFVYRLLGLDLTLEYSEVKQTGEGNTVYISETLSKDSNVTYSAGNGSKVKAGQEIKLSITKVAANKKLAINVICPDQNLVASGAGIVNDFSKPLVSVVIDKAQAVTFSMPAYPVEIIVYEVSPETASTDEPEKELTPEEIRQQKIQQVAEAAAAGFGSVEDTIKVTRADKKNYISFDSTVSENIVTIIKGNKLVINDPQAVEGSFNTSDKKTVKINKKGVIKAMKPGTVTISYLGDSDGKKECQIKVNVIAVTAQKEEGSEGNITFKKMKGTTAVGSQYSMVISLPINATYEIKDKKGVMGTKGTDYIQSFTPDGKIEFKGTAKQSGTATIIFNVYGTKVKVKLKAEKQK